MANTVSLETSKILIKSFVWSIALYGAETWTILEAESAGGDSLKIPWTEKVENEEVYLRMNERKTTWKTIREKRKNGLDII